MFGSIRLLQYTHLMISKFIQYTKTLRLQHLTIGTILLKVVVLLVLEMKRFPFQDMHSEGISTNSQASDMCNPKIQLKLHQQLWTNLMK
jgi:hypothetical protein